MRGGLIVEAIDVGGAIVRIMLLVDDALRAQSLLGALSCNGHMCCEYSDRSVLLKKIRGQIFDLVILDLARYDEICENLTWLRRNFPAIRIPILCICDACSEPEIAHVLECGADDFVLASASDCLILARVNAISRRLLKAVVAGDRMVFGEIDFDLCNKKIFVRGKGVEVTHKEFELALLFFENISKPLSRNYLIDLVWGGATYVQSRTMDTHISKVRRKLGLRPQYGYRLISLYAFGYMLERVGGCESSVSVSS
ncbi:response regulator transcription factor [Burkholderia sp. JSH-S8]|nr:response regulator transcription factor [Burkholderia sp. JSH-S8]